MANKKHPFIYWSQTENEVNINVDISPTDSNPKIKLDEKFVSLEANGFDSNGQDGPYLYHFYLNLFEGINIEKSEIRVTDDGIMLSLKKQNSAIWWPRITTQPQKPAYVHIDTKKWIPEPKSTESVAYRDIRQDYPGIDEILQKQEFGYSKVHPKTVYLIFYNISQFIGYLYILLVLAISWQRDGYQETIRNTYKTAGNAIKFCQLLQYLEVMHPLFGYTQGSILFPFLQVNGRNFILFILIDAESRIQTKPVILHLFITWALIECIRYPFYSMSLFKKDIPLLTWLRYTIWIPLYPLGVLCEGIIVIRCVPFFEQTQKFNVYLPNKWNISFSMALFMKCYLFLLISGGYILMQHMMKIRKKKLNAVKIYVDKKRK